MKTGNANILTTRYGGVVPIVNKLIDSGFPELIDGALDEMFPRAIQSKYKYSDMFLTWIVAAMCGATRIDNVTGLRDELKDIPGLNVPSHDTMGRLMKKLAAELKGEDRDSQKMSTYNEWDDNILLNTLLIKTTKLIGALDECEEYILDVDCTFISTLSANAEVLRGKENAQGYYPMVCLINNLPVFISWRNGNSTADFRQEQCVSQCLDLLEGEDIRIKYVRTDGAGYREGLTEAINKRGIKFLTASPVNPAFKRMLRQFNTAEWEGINIETARKFKDCEIAEIRYSMTNLDEEWRVIALRIPKKEGSINPRMEKLKNKGKLKPEGRNYPENNWNDIKGYKYKMITTNDWDSDADELFYLYNQRGTAERNFDFMKNDFGWKYPPFQMLTANTVFFIVSAMANNVFRGIAKLVHEEIDELELNARVRRFQKIFIDVVATCVNGKWSFYSEKVDFEKIC